MKNFCEKAAQNSQLQLRDSGAVNKNAFYAYETSWETEYLDSERNRIIYSELIDWKREPDWRDEYEKILVNKTDTVTQQIIESTIDINDGDKNEEDNEEKHNQLIVDDKTRWWTKLDYVKSRRPRTLREIALSVQVKGFQKEDTKIDDRITCQDAIDFGLDADVTLPFIDLLKFNNEEFWKRKVKKELNNPFEFEKLKRKSGINWKQISVELNFKNFVENLNTSGFKYDVDRDKIVEYINGLNDYIEHLNITKLKSRIIPSTVFPIVNFSSYECEHVSLEFLGNLKKLKSLSIEFNPGTLNHFYKRRFFKVATKDVANLALGLVNLKALQTLEIVHLNLQEHEKISLLLESIVSINSLTCLNLTHCSITSEESGMHFKNFFSQNSFLQRLELRENNLNGAFCEHFADGLLNFRGHLKYLGMAFNSILRDGLKFIIRSIIKKDNVEELNVCGCEGGKRDSYEEFVKVFCALLRETKKLKFLDISCNHIPDASLRKNIVNAINENISIVNFVFNPEDFPSSAPTATESFQMEVLNRRNKFYADNPILRKDTFTKDDEIKCIKWLKRTRNPALLKYKRNFVPSEVKVKHENQTLEKISSKDYENFLFSFHPGLNE